MLQITKIFRFETAHAIFDYSGDCSNIHGHSYEFHVTISTKEKDGEYIPAPGLVYDFKELKKLVIESVIRNIDHKMLLSQAFIAEHPELASQKNLVIMEAEPTAENLLIYMQRILATKLPVTVKLAELKLYETKDSFARWVADNKVP